MKKNLMLFGVVVLAALLTGGKCGGGGTTGDTGSYESGDCAGGGYCGDQAITVTADVSSSEALFISSESGSVVGSVSAGKAITVSSESPLYKVTPSGILEVLSAAYDSNVDALSSLPKLSYVAVSPLGHVILVFEYSFIYRDEADGVSIGDYSDPWSPSSPFTCQIFVVDKKLGSLTDASASPGLTCITNELEINTWDSRSAMVQFDGADVGGNVYFTAHVPGNWKNVLLKWTPGTDDTSTDADESVDGTLSEVINANICFREYLVTNEGGVLYTGITSANGDCGGGDDSFLRYKTPSGNLQEITSGWWEYVFKPVESTDFVSLNIAANITAAANTGQILFYGPDPEIATTPEWDDSCLFLFNPDATGLARSIKIADCNIDMWQYIDFADDMATKRTRCTETKSMMGGGNIPEKILLADFTGDGTNYEIYVVGNIYEKAAGEWRYDMCANEEHCVNSGGVPTYTYLAQGTCEAVAGNTWKTYGDCYNQFTDLTLYTALNTGGAAANYTNWQLNGQWCQQPAGDWKSTYSAFALAIWNGDNDTPTDDSDDTKSIVRFSDSDEIVKNGWNIGNRLVYSSFNTDDGTYKLREIIWNDDGDGNFEVTDGADDDTVPDEITKNDLLTGIEVYELLQDPRSSDKWFFNGLVFTDKTVNTDNGTTTLEGNSYVTGTFNPDADDVEGSLRAETSFTGQIETLVIVPNL